MIFPSKPRIINLITTILKIPNLQDYLVLAVVVRELLKHQCCFLFDCCVVIARFALLSCYSSVKTRIRPVKLYHSSELTLSSGFSSLLAVNLGDPGIRDNLSFIALSPNFCSRLLMMEGCPSHPLVFSLFMWNSQPR